jgi:hypothetical protein
MPIRISKPTQSLETRLLKYSLAAGALCAAPSAHANIIFSGDLNLSTTASLSVNFNPLAPAVFSLVVNPTGIDATPSGPGTAFNVGPLTLGTPITLDNSTSTGTIKLVHGIGSTPSGAWSSTNSGYLGVSFTVSSNQYLGWAKLLVDQGTPSVTLVNYAYEDQPGVAIAAGDTGAVPEPSSLTLFALGAAGVLAVRRRRQAKERGFRQS